MLFHSSFSSILELLPATGRTHQLRLHMLSIGHPILGDRFYAPKEVIIESPQRLLLHSECIHIMHPRTGNPIKFYANSNFERLML